MILSEVLKTISVNATKILPDVSIISFGSNSIEGDIDLLIYNNRAEKHINYFEIKKEIRNILKLLELSLPFIYEIFTFNLHRNFIFNNSKKIHLLYFPSLISFSQVELPSLLGYISKDGVILSGNRLPFSFFENYKNRKPILKDLFEFHFFSYNNLAINYLIYYLSNSTFISRYDILEKITYCIKFSLIELLNEFFPNSKNYFPDWIQIKNIKYFNFIDINGIYEILEHKKIGISNLDFLFKEYFKIYNYGIDLKMNNEK